MKKFNYKFDDTDEDVNFTTNPHLSELDTTKIRINVEENNKIWISANSEGWIHLAKLCIQFGLGKYENGYHFHANFQFGFGDFNEPEITFEVDNSL
jgi:hypothetical protein